MLVLFALPSKLIIINQSNVNTTTAHDHDDDVGDGGVGGGIQHSAVYLLFNHFKQRYIEKCIFTKIIPPVGYHREVKCGYYTLWSIAIEQTTGRTNCR